MKNHQPMRVLLAEPDPRAEAQFREAVYLQGAEWVGSYDSLTGVIEFTVRERPDLILASMTLQGGDGLSLLSKLRALRAPSLPAMALGMVPGFEAAGRKASTLGARAILCKPYSRETILAALAPVQPYDRLPPDFAETTRAKQALNDLHVPVRLKGYIYLAETVMLAARDQRLLSALNSELYPAVAEKLGTKGNLVERSIRTAIEAAWSGGQIEALYEFFGDTIDERRGKPTNREFIARVLSALRVEE